MPNNEVTISEIQDYLRTQRSEDEIETKAKDRVTRAMATNIHAIKDIPVRNCNLCGRLSEKTTPIDMKVCLVCANRFIKRGLQINVINKQTLDYHCDHCFTRTFKVLYINPNVCEYCSKKIGKRHNSNSKEVGIQRRRING